MFRIAVGVFLAVHSLAVGASSQSLTPEELEAMINERVNAQNPYQALLADPDPERSLAAMQIMLESADDDLVRMALEFGLLSPNPTVRRIAVEAFMTTGPVLSIRFDGSAAMDTEFPQVIRNYLGGSIDDQGVGFTRVIVGPMRDDGACFVDTINGNCLFGIQSDGVYLSDFRRNDQPFVRALLEVTDAGHLQGYANFMWVDNPIPVTIQLLD